MNRAQAEYWQDWAPSPDDPGYQLALTTNQALATAARELSRELGGLDLRDVFVGCCRAPGFPAVTMSTHPGALTLIDLSFTLVVANTTWIIAATLPDDRGTSPLGREGGAAALRSFLSTVANEQPVPYAVPPPELPAGRAELASHLGSYALGFTVGHELAHVALGHTLKSVETLRTREGKDAMINPFSWRDEFEADLEGATAARALRGPDGRKHELGATIVLEVMQSLDKLGWPADSPAKRFFEAEFGRSLDPLLLGTLSEYPAYPERRTHLLWRLDPGRAPDTPEVDSIAELMWLVRGEALPVGDKHAVRAVDRFIEMVMEVGNERGAELARELDTYFELPSLDHPLGWFDAEGLTRFMERDRRVARAAVAASVISYVTTGYALKQPHLWRTGLLLAFYLGKFEDRRLHKLVTACIPNIDEVIHEETQKLRGITADEASIAAAVRAATERRIGPT